MGGDETTIHTAPLDLNEYNIKCKDEEGKEAMVCIKNRNLCMVAVGIWATILFTPVFAEVC